MSALVLAGIISTALVFLAYDMGVFDIANTLLFGGKPFVRKESGGLLKSSIRAVHHVFKPPKNRSARFLSNRESRALFGKKSKGVLLDGYRRRLSQKNSFTGIVVTAPSGAGKTTKFILPNIFTLASEGNSLVVTDISGEVFLKTSGYLHHQGYDLQVLNLADLSRGLRYNPLAHIQSYNDAVDLAHVIVKSANPQGYSREPVWYKGAENILTVLITTLHAMETIQS